MLLHQGTPSTIGLNVGRPDPLGTTHTQMLSAQTYATYLTDKEQVMAKQTNSDAVANPSDIKLDIRPNQPEIAFDPQP